MRVYLFWPTTEIQMGIEYTIKRKSFSQTYSTRHLTRLLCFFTTNLCVINKNKATKKKMYTIYLYFCWGLVIDSNTFLSRLLQNLHIYKFENFKYVKLMQQCHCMFPPFYFSTARVAYRRQY